MDEGRWTIDFAREGREDRRQKSEDRNFELGGREGVEAGGQGIGGKKKADGDGMRVWENRLPTMMKKLREEIKGSKRFLTLLFDSMCLQMFMFHRDFEIKNDKIK
jgi:hypothetical protein